MGIVKNSILQKKEVFFINSSSKPYKVLSVILGSVSYYNTENAFMVHHKVKIFIHNILVSLLYWGNNSHYNVINITPNIKIMPVE